MKLPNWQRIKNHVLDTPFSQGIPYWAGGLLVGLVAWFYSGSFSKAIETCAEILETHPYWLFIISPSCLVLARWIVERFAPEATGTGIPQVIRALKCETPLEQGTIERTLSSRTALVVMASSILCVLGAGGLGREGPMVHVGACILYVTGRQLSRIWPFEEHRSWIMAGAAAGIAAAFNAPLAGVVFVLEELSQQHFHQFKTVVLSSAIVGGVTSQWLSGRFLFLGYPKVAEIPLSSIPWALGLGLLAGVFAYPFHWMVGPKLDYWFKHYFKTRIQIAFVVGILLAATAIFVSPRSIGGGVGLIQALLFEEGYRADLTTIAGRFLSTTLAHLSGCAGGFLGPALGLGGAIGSWFATITEYPNHNLLVMVGMSAFLSAIIRAPFTAWVIVMEMTDRHSAIFPLMVASLASAAFLSLIEKLAAPTSPNSPPH